MLRILVSAVGMLMLALPATAQPKWAQGQTYSGNIDIGGVQVPLPAGQWTVLGFGREAGGILKDDRPVSDSGTMMHVALGPVGSEKFTGMVLLEYNERAGRGTGWNVTNAKTCSREDIHHAQVLMDKQLSKVCQYVNHITWSGVGSNTSAWFKQAIASLTAQERAHPKVMIESGIVVSDRMNFLSMRYRFNPEVIGFPVARAANWSSSEWSQANVQADAKRQAFVKLIIDWTEKTRPAIEAGLAGKLKKGDGLDWPVAMQ